MPGPLIALAAAAPAVFSAIGELLSGGRRAEAEELRRKAMAEIQGLDIPPIEFIEAQQLGDSEFTKIQGDPRLQQAQMAALNELSDVGRSGGLRLSDKARYAEVEGDIASHERGQREAILQNARARGAGGSGFELAAQLQNQQGAAQRLSQQGMDIAGRAQDAALDSIVKGGQLAGDIRSQDYGEKARAAAAQDSVRQWDATQRGNTNVFNVGQKQQDYENRAKKAGMTAGALQGQAGALEGSADRTSGQLGAVGQGVGQGVGAYAQNQAYEEWLKKQPGGK